MHIRDLYLIHVPDLYVMHIYLPDPYLITDAHTMCLILDNIAYIPDLSVTHISDLSLFETQISCLKNKFI